jgi:hypothetical protein
MADGKYHLKYMVERGQWTREELAGAGGCDAMVLVSILRGPEPHSGANSIAFLHVDGYSADAPPMTEVFQVFVHLAHQLAESDELPRWQRELAQQTFDTAQAVILRDRRVPE